MTSQVQTQGRQRTVARTIHHNTDCSAWRRDYSLQQHWQRRNSRRKTGLDSPMGGSSPHMVRSSIALDPLEYPTIMIYDTRHTLPPNSCNA